MKLTQQPAEWWPVLILDDMEFYKTGFHEYSDEEIERIKVCEKEFNAVQRMIGEKRNDTSTQEFKIIVI